VNTGHLVEYPGVTMFEWLKLGAISLLLSTLLTAVVLGPVLLLAR